MPRITPSTSRIDSDVVTFFVIVLFFVCIVVGMIWKMSEDYGCPSCGHIANPADVYCTKCGKQLRVKR